MDKVNSQYFDPYLWLLVELQTGPKVETIEENAVGTAVVNGDNTSEDNSSGVTVVANGEEP